MGRNFSLANGSFSFFTQAPGWQVVPVIQNEYNARPVIGNIHWGNVIIDDFCNPAVAALFKPVTKGL